MKIKFQAVQLFMIGLLVSFATSCDDKQKEEELTPKTIEECAFFTAKYSKTQVWEVEIDQELGGSYGENFEIGKTATFTIKGPARTLNTMQNEAQAINWGTATDRYLQFKIEKGGSYSQIIDDIKNDSATYIVPALFEKNGTPSEDYDSSLDPGTVVCRGAEGFVVRFHCSEETYYMYFSSKTLTNPTTISLKLTQGQVEKLSELGNGKIETQLDKLNKVLPTAGGVTTVVFKSGATYGSMTDLNGNTYKTITIGTQTWMAENLRTTKYRNGESISIVNIDSEWAELTSGACCSKDNTIDKNSVATTGILYNWYAVSDSRNIAPKGWHIPTKAEWATLITSLGGEEVAGSKLKEKGTTNWLELNTDATNESGFSATLSAGRNSEDGRFYEQSHSASYWTNSLNIESDYPWIYYLNNEDSYISESYCDRANGLSVRLIKD